MEHHKDDYKVLSHLISPRWFLMNSLLIFGVLAELSVFCVCVCSRVCNEDFDKRTKHNKLCILTGDGRLMSLEREVHLDV